MDTCTSHHFACPCREEKFKRLYMATNYMVSRCIAEDRIAIASEEMIEVIAALNRLSGEIYEPNMQFTPAGEN